MSKLDSFKDFTQSIDHIINKDYYFGSVFQTSFTFSSPLGRFHSRLALNEKGASYPSFVSAWEELKSEHFKFKAKKQSDGSLKASLVYDSSEYPLVLSANYVQVSGCSNVQIDYLSKIYNFSVVAKPLDFTVAWNTGSRFGLAGDFTAGYDALYPRLFSLALWVKDGNNKLYLKHQNLEQNLFTLGTVQMGVLQVRDKLKVGLLARLNWVDRSVSQIISGQWEVSDRSSVKTRVSSDGKIGVVYKNWWSDRIEGQISGELEGSTAFWSPFSQLKLGLRVNIKY